MSKLNKVRQKLKLSRKDLADLIGKSSSAISNYENGYRNLSIEDAYKILDFAKSSKVKISLEDLYPRD